MICEKCKTEFDGSMCPVCSERPSDNSKKISKILGFRSNKTWKKILSILYLIIIFCYVIIYFTTIESANDAIIAIQGFLLMISPYVFLSNFKFRNYLPFFKEHKKGKSLIGLIVVYIAITIVCMLVNPATFCEHKWIETEHKEATCSAEGSINSSCELCGKGKVEYIDKAEHSFDKKEKNKKEKKCLICGEVIKVETTTKKNDSTTEKTTEKAVHTHSWVDASCLEPSKCNICGATKDSALGHTTDCGICTRCNEEFRKKSPITILNWTYDIDYAGGVEWNFNIKNNTDKQIKYVVLKWECYNAVGDLVYDEISWKPYVKVRFTGPLDAYATSDRKRNTTKFYNYNVDNYKLIEAEVEYMDGTIETLNEYYDDVIE